MISVLSLRTNGLGFRQVFFVEGQELFLGLGQVFLGLGQVFLVTGEVFFWLKDKCF